MSTMTTRHDSLRAQTRLAAIVVIAAALGWLALGFLGGVLGWPPRLALLIDFAALGAFAWALIVLLRVWRARRGGE